MEIVYLQQRFIIRDVGFKDSHAHGGKAKMALICIKKLASQVYYELPSGNYNQG